MLRYAKYVHYRYHINSCYVTDQFNPLKLGTYEMQLSSGGLVR